MGYSKRFRKYLFSIIYLSLANFPCAAKTIDIHAVNYPPYEIKNPIDGLEGFNVEVAKAAFSRVGIDATVIFKPWKRVQKYMENGLISSALSCTYLKERSHYMALSQPISRATRVLVVKQGYSGPKLRSLEDTLSMSGIGIRGYALEAELTQLNIPHVILNSDVQALRFLVSERGDFFYAEKENTEFLAKQLGLSDQLQYFELEDDNFYLCFSKNWPGYEKLLEQFNRGLKMIKEDGTYQAIQSRYQ